MFLYTVESRLFGENNSVTVGVYSTPLKAKEAGMKLLEDVYCEFSIVRTPLDAEPMTPQAAYIARGYKDFDDVIKYVAHCEEANV